MGDITLISLSDDDEQTITREQYLRWRDLCRYCATRLPARRVLFCSRRCRRLARRGSK